MKTHTTATGWVQAMQGNAIATAARGSAGASLAANALRMAAKQALEANAGTVVAVSAVASAEGESQESEQASVAALIAAGASGSAFKQRAAMEAAALPAAAAAMPAAADRVLTAYTCSACCADAEEETTLAGLNAGLLTATALLADVATTHAGLTASPVIAVPFPRRAVAANRAVQPRHKPKAASADDRKLAGNSPQQQTLSPDTITGSRLHTTETSLMSSTHAQPDLVMGVQIQLDTLYGASVQLQSQAPASLHNLQQRAPPAAQPASKAVTGCKPAAVSPFAAYYDMLSFVAPPAACPIPSQGANPMLMGNPTGRGANTQIVETPTAALNSPGSGLHKPVQHKHRSTHSPQPHDAEGSHRKRNSLIPRGLDSTTSHGLHASMALPDGLHEPSQPDGMQGC